jgi:hypothetical protein
VLHWRLVVCEGALKLSRRSALDLDPYGAVGLDSDEGMSVDLRYPSSLK